MGFELPGLLFFLDQIRKVFAFAYMYLQLFFLFSQCSSQQQQQLIWMMQKKVLMTLFTFFAWLNQSWNCRSGAMTKIKIFLEGREERCKMNGVLIKFGSNFQQKKKNKKCGKRRRIMSGFFSSLCPSRNYVIYDQPAHGLFFFWENVRGGWMPQKKKKDKWETLF